MCDTDKLSVKRNDAGDGVEVSVPASLMPMLYEWAGRLQREVHKPFEVVDVALAMFVASNKIEEQLAATGTTTATLTRDDMFNKTKDAAIWMITHYNYLSE